MRRVVKAVDDTLKKGKLVPTDICHVLCVGGSSHIPMVQAALKEFFQPMRVQVDGRSVVRKGPKFVEHPAEHPHFVFTAIARGAAIRAAQLSRLNEVGWFPFSTAKP